MVVRVVVNEARFPEPDLLLTGFQLELQGMLRQLSSRLLTLAQSTFLPSSAFPAFSCPQPPPASSLHPLPHRLHPNVSSLSI